MLEQIKTKWHWHDYANAPSLINQHGSLIQLLDACLVNGYNQTAILSSIIDEKLELIITLSTNHNFNIAQVVKIENSSDPIFNRDFRIKSTTSNTITISLDETFIGKSITGLATIKIAPCGWEIVYTSATKRGYRPLSTQSDGLIFYVNDEKDPLLSTTTNYAKYARVCLCESVDDFGRPTGATLDAEMIDGAYTSTTQTEDNLRVGKQRIYYARTRSAVDNVAPSDGQRRWYIVGDDRSVYIMPGIYSTNSTYGNQLGSHFVGHIGLYNPHERFSTNTALFTCNTISPVASSNTVSPWNYEALFTSSIGLGCLFNHDNHLTNLWTRGLLKTAQSGSQVFSGGTSSSIAPVEDYQDCFYASPTYVYTSLSSKHSLIGKLPGSGWFMDDMANYFTESNLWNDQRSENLLSPFQILKTHYTDAYVMIRHREDWY